MRSGDLIPEQVTPLLVSGDAALQKATLAVIAERAAWGPVVGDLLRAWLARPNLERGRQESVRGLLLGLAKDKTVQEIVAQALENPTTPPATRLLLLEAMAGAPLPKLPAPWVRELGQALRHPHSQVVQQAVATLRAATDEGAPDASTSLRACGNVVRR